MAFTSNLNTLLPSTGDSTGTTTPTTTTPTTNTPTNPLAYQDPYLGQPFNFGMSAPQVDAEGNVVTNTTSPLTSLGNWLNLPQYTNPQATTTPTQPVLDPTTGLQNIYQTELGRAADPEGLAYYTNLLNSGMSLADIQNEINASAEGTQFDNTAKLQNVYQNELGRVADPEGLAYYTNLLKSGSSLEDIQKEINASTEGMQFDPTGNVYNPNPLLTQAKINEAQTWAQQNLNRQLTDAELRQLNIGYNGSNLYDTIKSGQELAAINQAYQTVYGRPPTEEELNAAKNQFGWKTAGAGTTDLLNQQISNWGGQLSTGELTPDLLSGITGMTSKVSDSLLTNYFNANPNAVTSYGDTLSNKILGSDYNASPEYTSFRTDLDNQLQTGKITASEYTNQLQNSDFNKNQEAIRFANMASSVLGLSQQEAVQAARDLYSGNTSEYSKYYDQLLKDPNAGVTSILTDAANKPDAASNPYFQQNPNALAIYKSVGDTIATRNGGAGGVYGYIDGKPLLKASEVDQIFDKKGSNYITGDLGKLDNDIGWDAGALDQLVAKGAGALGVRKYEGSTDPETGIVTPTTYSKNLNQAAQALGIDPNAYQDIYKTEDRAVIDENGTSTTEKVQVLVKSAQDQLYDAIDRAAQDFVFIAGKSGTKAGGIGEEYNGVMQTAAFQDAPKNHAAQMFRRIGDKYVPVGDTKFYNGEMEMSKGSWFSNTFGGFALPLAIGSMFAAPGLAAALGGGLGGAAGAGAILGGGMSAVTGGDVLKGAALGGLGGGLSTQVGNIGQSFSNIGIMDPNIQNILARGTINLGMGLASGAPLSTVATNTGINTGLNLGLNATGIPSTPTTNLATSVLTPLMMTGSVNPMTIANAGIRAAQQSTTPTTTMKQGGLAHMKTGGKVKGGLAHFEDGGYADYGSLNFDFPSYDLSAPSFDFGSIDFSSPSYDFLSPSFSFDSPTYDFGSLDTSSWDFGSPTFDQISSSYAETDPNLYNVANPNYFNDSLYSEGIPSIDISGVGSTGTTESGGLETPSTVSQTQLDDATKYLQDQNTGNNVWDQEEPKAVYYTAEQYQNEDINDPLGRNSVIIKDSGGNVVGVIDSDGKVVKGDLEVRVSENPRTGQVEYQYVDQNGHVVGGFDENGSWFNSNLTQSTAGSTDVITGDPGRYAGSNEPLGGTPTTNFGGNLANKSDVDRLMSSGWGGLGGFGTNTVKDTITKMLGGGSGQQQQKQAGNVPDIAGLTNLTGSVTQASPNYTLSGVPTFTPTVNPMYKAAGGRINLPQFQALNNYIDHNFDSNYAPQMANGGQTHGGGLEHIPEFYSEGGLNNRYVKGRGDGTSDDVPAMLANGEFVIPADVVSGLGNGSNDSGAKILDEFLKVIRRDKRAASPDKLPADSKGPQAYLLQAKRKVRK